MFQPGERFHYNNAGYILLGLIVEELTGLEFTEYIDKNIFLPCEMKNSGYFSMDQLPKNTALGYIDEENGAWRTNVYSLPILKAVRMEERILPHQICSGFGRGYFPISY